MMRLPLPPGAKSLAGRSKAMAHKYDLLLKGGEIIDTMQGIRGLRDVAFAAAVG